MTGMADLAERDATPVRSPAAAGGDLVLDARAVFQRFGSREVLSDVSFAVARGEIHAILGPNGAGKTTLIRILAGLQQPSAGAVEVAGYQPAANARSFRQQVGFVASGDRTFYLRLSGLENLVFFGRMHGMSRREAVRRGMAVLEQVALTDAARKRVGEYSHGMQKRLSVARALLAAPPVLLIDEATHDLDPEAAHRVRDLVTRAARDGAAVVWVTQRLDEIRGFADNVTVLHAGRVRFRGSVAKLMSHATPRRYLLHVAGEPGPVSPAAMRAALGGGATLHDVPGESGGHYVLALGDDTVLGDALTALLSVGAQVLSCTEERSEIEEAFLMLVDAEAT